MGPGVGVGVFVFRSRQDRRFLLGKRKGSIGAGTWSLAGGHVDHNETFVKCAVREVEEETGLEIEDVQFLTACENFFTAEDKHYVTIFMTAFVKTTAGGDVPEPKLMEPDKCEGWSWFSFKQMREMDEAGSDHDLFLPLKNLIAQRPSICVSMENNANKSSGRP